MVAWQEKHTSTQIPSNSASSTPCDIAEMPASVLSKARYQYAELLTSILRASPGASPYIVISKRSKSEYGEYELISGGSYSTSPICGAQL